MNRPASTIALCSAQLLPVSAAGAVEVPEWIHLLPAGPVGTNDGRGPYKVRDAAALMAASIADGTPLVLDENHATDLAAPKGQSAPARGWIVELQARQDGIWGRVEWTAEGRRLVEDRAYRGVSPVIAHQKDGTIVAIRRASLVNQPNLSGLTALHQEKTMDLKEMLIEALGLDPAASDEDVVAAVKKWKDMPGGDATKTALQSALSPIALAAGLAATSDQSAVLVGVQQLAARAKQGGDNAVITALQSELADVTGKLNTLTESTARKDAESYVDGAIREGRVGVKPMRDEYIAMHMEDRERTEKLIGAMPVLKGSHASAIAPSDPTKPGQLSEADNQVIALMGLDPEEYRKSLAASGAAQEEAL